MKTGRGRASEFTFRDLPRLREKQSKTFTREWGKRFGFDTGIQDMVAVLSVQKLAKQRRLDAKKRLQLSHIFQSAIMETIDEDEQLVELQLAISKVDIPPAFQEITVFWVAKGNETDERAKEVLAAAQNSVRRRLSEKFGNSRTPAVVFRMDDSHILQAKMDSLFEQADYGMQYRVVSHTAAVLGSLSDSGEQSEKQTKKRREAKKPPLINRLERSVASEQQAEEAAKGSS